MKSIARKLVVSMFIAIAATGLFFRSAGVFRGLEAGPSYHPDETKQIVALGNYLEGEYIWYVGSPFYDGYPYGLNHIDEWILRPVFAVYRSVWNHVEPDNISRTPPSQYLFYWARGLRILYGMLVLVLGYAIAKKMFGSNASAMATLLIMSIAPILITTSHFGTGDVGVDLFSALMLFLLCLHHEKSRLIYLLLAGVALGVAFGCKYNGLLGGIAIAVYISVKTLSSKSYRRFVGHALLSGVGLLGGILLSTPALLLSFRRTWRDIRINFRFIKDYGLSTEFLEKPFIERAAISFTENTPRIIASIGWALFFVAAAGLLVCIAVNLKRLMSKREDAERKPLDALGLAVFTYGFASLIISVAGKGMPQVFHFSYTLLPLTLSAVYFLTMLWRTRNIVARAVTIALAGLIIGESALVTEQEHFFWSRQDSANIARNLPRRLFSEESLSGELMNIKSLVLEPGRTIPVFRNRRRHLVGPHVAEWRQTHILPVPHFPYPVSTDWVFMNGPVFPRNDRMLLLGENESISRVLVYQYRPELIHVGIRSGDFPVRVTGRIGGEKLELDMLPNQQRVVAVNPEKIRTTRRFKAEDYSVYFVAADIKTNLGSATINFMSDQSEVENFMIYGGSASSRRNMNPPDGLDREMIEKLFSTALFYEETFDEKIKMNSSGTAREQRVGLPLRKTPLAAGIYTVEIGIVSESDGNVVTIDYDDPLGLNALNFEPQKYALEEGHNVVRFPLRKSFAPYMSRFLIHVRQGRGEIESLKIQPDLDAILVELLDWSETGSEPAWLASVESREISDLPPEDSKLAFGSGIRFVDIDIPESVVIGEKLMLRCPVIIDDFNIRDFNRLDLFIHFMNDRGEQSLAVDVPLWIAANTIDNDLAVPFGEVDLPVGSYRLMMGIYNNRTLKRLNVTNGTMLDRATRRQRVDIGAINVVEEQKISGDSNDD